MNRQGASRPTIMTISSWSGPVLYRSLRKVSANNYIHLNIKCLLPLADTWLWHRWEVTQDFWPELRHKSSVCTRPLASIILSRCLLYRSLILLLKASSSQSLILQNPIIPWSSILLSLLKISNSFHWIYDGKQIHIFLHTVHVNT